MRLLLDQNLSPTILAAVSDLYPGSLHVQDAGLERADDEAVWIYALEQRLTIVSKDADFHQRSFVLGHPPTVVWIRRGNCATEDIVTMLRDHHAEIVAFELDEERAFLALG